MATSNESEANPREATVSIPAIISSDLEKFLESHINHPTPPEEAISSEQSSSVQESASAVLMLDRIFGRAEGSRIEKRISLRFLQRAVATSIRFASAVRIP
jgi:hypothetical protein